MEDLLGTDINASELWDQALSLIMTYAPKVVLAIITLVLGLWLINRCIGVLDKKLGAKDPTLNKFLCGLISAILKVMLLSYGADSEAARILLQSFVGQELVQFRTFHIVLTALQNLGTT